jgi:hypothetical protein
MSSITAIGEIPQFIPPSPPTKIIPSNFSNSSFLPNYPFHGRQIYPASRSYASSYYPNLIKTLLSTNFVVSEIFLNNRECFNISRSGNSSSMIVPREDFILCLEISRVVKDSSSFNQDSLIDSLIKKKFSGRREFLFIIFLRFIISRISNVRWTIPKC